VGERARQRRGAVEAVEHEREVVAGQVLHILQQLGGVCRLLAAETVEVVQRGGRVGGRRHV
jgi:hypothetical protein